MNWQDVIALLKEEMVVALGVTEPGAIALACANAYTQVKGDLESVEITMDPGSYKNAFSCAVPGTEEKGIAIAALLGVLAGNPAWGLEVLKDITPDQIAKAKELRDKGLVTAQVERQMPDLYIDARVKTTQGCGRTIIQGNHTNIAYTEANGEVTFTNQEKENKDGYQTGIDLSTYKLADFVDFATQVPFAQIEFVLEAIEVNKRLMQTGMQGAGMGLGVGVDELVKTHKLGDDLRTQAEILTAYAVDARMGGVFHPAMSICGSGDHGIIATMPLLAVAERNKLTEECLARAIVLSYLITIYIKGFSGRLSAFCGCAVAAGTGACGAITYMLGGTLEQIGHAIHNMAANLTGIVCDGGNFGCSLKAVNGAGTAILSALLALEDVVIPNSSGIVGNTVEETMQNMGAIASPGMLKTNETIIDIMMRAHDLA